VFFRDPFLFHALNGHVSRKDPYEHSVKLLDSPELKSRLVEQTVAGHCAGTAFSMAGKKTGFGYQSSVFCWKGRAKREVDFVVRDNDRLIPIEVRYRTDIKKDDFYGLIDFAKAAKTQRGIIIAKNDLRVESEAVLVPASLFLLLA